MTERVGGAWATVVSDMATTASYEGGGSCVIAGMEKLLADKPSESKNRPDDS